VTILSVLMIAFGLVLVLDGNSDAYRRVLGLILAIVGPILCWISGFIVYGFGELVDRVCSMEQMLEELMLQNEKSPQTRVWEEEDEFADEGDQNPDGDEPLYNPVENEIQSKTPPPRG